MLLQSTLMESIQLSVTGGHVREGPSLDASATGAHTEKNEICWEVIKLNVVVRGRRVSLTLHLE